MKHGQTAEGFQASPGKQCCIFYNFPSTLRISSIFFEARTALALEPPCSRKTTKTSLPRIKLISDIDKHNISSIKIHLANGFQFSDTIKYPNKHSYERYILEL